jgi:hypothetical protein
VEGFDDEGREVLEYVAGEIRDSYDDDELISIAELIRRLHDATTTFQPPEDAAWQRLPGTPQAADVICHNDFSPANLVFRTAARVRSSTGTSRRRDCGAGTSRMRSIASSLSIRTTTARDSGSRNERGGRASKRSAAPTGST